MSVPTPPSGVPPTYVRDADVTGAAVTVADGTIAVRNTGAPLDVQVMGTLPVAISVAGSFTAIGIADPIVLANIQNNQGTLANETTLGVTNASIGVTNSILSNLYNAQGTLSVTVSTAGLASEPTLAQLMNSQGTLATAAAQTNGNSYLASLVLQTGTLATSMGQTTGNTLLTVIANNQGTLASNSSLTAIQNNGSQANTSLASIDLSTYQTKVQLQDRLPLVYNNQGTLASESALQTTNSLLQSLIVVTGTASGTILTATLFGTQVGAATSPAVDVSGRTQHSVQHVVNGAVSIQTQTSLNGTDWFVESTDTASTLLTLEGVTKYIRASTTGAGTVSSYLMSSSPGGGGGGSSSISENAFSATLSQTLNTAYTLALNNANGIGFYLVPPTGGAITFEGSWDGVTWESITLRQMGAHGYSSMTSETENWVGSVSSFKYLRFRTSTGGSGSGSIVGKLTYSQNTLEGIEHGYSPHKIGSQVYSVHRSIGSICSNELLYAPTSALHKLCISDILLFVNDATTTITLSDGSYALNEYVFRATVKPSGGVTQIIPVNYTLPHVFAGVNRPLYFTQTGAANVDVNIHLYESES